MFVVPISFQTWLTICLIMSALWVGIWLIRKVVILWQEGTDALIKRMNPPVEHPDLKVDPVTGDTRAGQEYCRQVYARWAEEAKREGRK